MRQLSYLHILFSVIGRMARARGHQLSAVTRQSDSSGERNVTLPERPNG